MSANAGIMNLSHHQRRQIAAALERERAAERNRVQSLPAWQRRLLRWALDRKTRNGLAKRPEGIIAGILFALTLTVTNTVAQGMLGDLKTKIDAGTAAIITIYDGSQPTDADTAIGAQVLLATLTMNATAFGAVGDDTPGAIMTAAAITADSSADATGTAAWFRMLTQAGGTTIMDGSVGTSGADINFNTVAFTAGSQIEITSMTIFIGETDAQTP